MWLIKTFNNIQYNSIQDGDVVVFYVNELYAKYTLTEIKKCISELNEKFVVKENIFKNTINVFLAPNRKEFEYLILNILKVNIKIPTNKARIAQPQRTDLILLCPTSYDTDSIYTYDEGYYKRLLKHEMIHMFQEHLNVDMENTSRWFAEGIAVYLSKQYEYEDEFKNPVIEGVLNKKIPSIEEINNNIVLCYDWGWTIVKYIDEVYGFDTVLNIFRNCGSYDVIGFMKNDKVEFEENWKAWLLSK